MRAGGAPRAAPDLRARWASAVGIVLGLVAALWLKTLRVRVLVDPHLREGRGEAPWVLSFFHGTQFPLLAWKRRKRTVVMVSHSQDGAMQARALGRLGFTIVRGSSSRGGARGLAGVIRHMKRDADAAFAVDGPRGPYGKAKEGALLAARAAGGVLVPMGSACARAWIAVRAWDAFALPLPFSRVHVVLGAPLAANATAHDLEVAIAAANDTAHRLIERRRLGRGSPTSGRAELESLPSGESPPHGDGIRELEIPAVGNAAGDA